MKFIIQRHVRREAAFKEQAYVFVGMLWAGELVAFEDAPGVSVHDEDRVLSGIKQDGIGGFRPDAVNAKELLAEGLGRSAKHFDQRALIFRSQEAHKSLQFLRFLPEVAGGTDERGQAAERYGFDGAGCEQFLAAKFLDGELDIAPRSILREDSPDDDLERRAARPPVLRAKSGK